MASPKHSHHRASAAPPASSNSNSKHMSNSKQHARATKQRPLSLRRAMLHSFVCFLVGLLTGFAPSDWTDAASRAAVHANAAATAQVFRALHAMNNTAAAGALGHLLTLQHYQSYQQQGKQQQQQPPLDLVVVVTTTTTSTGLSERERRSAGLTRTAHALRLVSPPVVWLVVESAREAGPTARLLRRTGVVYRHLTYGENFTSEAWEEERHHQRNQALAHIEQHRLRGVVLFAGLADVYDVRLLEHLRRIRTVGAWPVATVWEQEKRVAVEGPVCTTAGTGTATAAWFSVSASEEAASTSPSPPVMTDDSVHGFAFASDLLWDPARWDRFPTSEPDQSQDSIKFVQRLVVADYNKTRPIPEYSNCSQIMVWRVDTTLL
ncbi:unnamed protein product [Miscanthus lutarioriparius]|uniref:Glycosyltransferases n=1 Tax=Miscanthus lutarioriparius TaxID=422564 RepID=A0A161I258_9POAL|nr:glycosyltransferase 43B [Miscanthus lutarioriparius]CAD6222299.1 unnamed protein product [Miscanthus lutarioriparius]